jgi:hypothetical protein
MVGNIKMGFKEIRYEGVDWIQLDQDRNQWRVLVNVMNEPSGSIKGGEILD